MVYIIRDAKRLPSRLFVVTGDSVAGGERWRRSPSRENPFIPSVPEPPPINQHFPWNLYPVFHIHFRCAERARDCVLTSRWRQNNTSDNNNNNNNWYSMLVRYARFPFIYIYVYIYVVPKHAPPMYIIYGLLPLIAAALLMPFCQNLSKTVTRWLVHRRDTRRHTDTRDL